MPAGDGLTAQAARIVAAADEASLPLRVLGGVAVALHAPCGLPAPLRRDYEDIDLVTTRRTGAATGRLLESLGYQPNQRFNALQGDRRLVFHDPDGRRVDVFVGEFRMCHAIPVADRLDVDSPTVPLAELLATKLQIVELNAKDADDIIGLLVEHDLARHDDDAVNTDWLTTLLAGDWGLWRTATGTLAAVRDRLVVRGLPAEQQALVRGRVDALLEAADRAPKTLRWRSRARLGTRVRWYDEPEEIAHA